MPLQLQLEVVPRLFLHPRLIQQTGDRDTMAIAYLQISRLICRSIWTSIEIDFRVVRGHLPRLFPRIPAFCKSVFYLGLRCPDLNKALRSVSFSSMVRDVTRMSNAAWDAGGTLPSYHAFCHPKIALRGAFVSAPETLLRVCSAPCSKCTIASVDLPRTYAVALQQSRGDLLQSVG